MARLQAAISTLYESAMTDNGQPENYSYGHGRQTAAVRRAGLDLTRALADMRKSPFEKLLGEKK
jgi:hypothetical protein